MNKKLRSQIKAAFEAPIPERKDAFVANLNYSDRRPWSFYITQASYIRKRVWILSGALLLFALYISFFCNENIYAICCVSALLPFLALIVITELSRSASFHMEELELSCKYSLPHVILARMLILGCFNLILFLSLLLLMSGKTGDSFIRLTLYLLTPYLLTCSCSLAVMNHKNLLDYSISNIGIAGFFSFIQLLIILPGPTLYENHYLSGWILLFLFSLLLLLKEVRSFIKHKEVLQWNSLSID